jgi:glycosyltransferase involved in cell wall biosynthesis
VNICVVTTRHSAKDDRIYYKEVLSLAKRWDKVTLIAPSDGKQEQTFHPRVRFVPLRKRHGFLGRCLMVADALNLLVRLRPDVCSFHDYDLAVVLPFAQALLRAKMVYDVHEFYPLAALPGSLPAMLKGPVRALVARLENAAARRCAFVTPVVEPLTSRFRTTGCRAVTIFNYVREGEIEFSPQRQLQVLDRYRGRKIIIYQGSISPERGLFQMISAMRIVKRYDSSATLLLVGAMSETLENQVNRQVTESSLTGCIEHVSWVDHTSIFDYISVAKIGLIPFLPVGQYPQVLPIKLFEYMACGVPVLAADLPAIRPYMEESAAGLLYDSTSPAALAEAVLKMLASEDALRRMGENGRKAVREKWNWGRMEERLLQAYGELDEHLQL